MAYLAEKSPSETEIRREYGFARQACDLGNRPERRCARAGQHDGVGLTPIHTADRFDDGIGSQPVDAQRITVAEIHAGLGDQREAGLEPKPLRYFLKPARIGSK